MNELTHRPKAGPPDMKITALRRVKSVLSNPPCFCPGSAMLACPRKLVRRYLDTKSVLLVNFLLAMVNLFLLVMHLHVRMPPPETYFYSPVTPTEKEQMISILRVLTSELHRSNIPYFIVGGTLLGSYRHHGPIPWDDDTDLCLLKKDLPRLKELVSKMGPTYRLYPGDTLAPSMKFFAINGSRKFIHHSFTWPYVDLFFVDGNRTHYLKTDLQVDPLPKNSIFPLVRRPYHDLWLLSPCNLSYALREYNARDCYSRRFSHVMELPMLSWAQRFLPCKKLFRMFPFVFRQHVSGPDGKETVLKEVLKVDNWVLKNISIHYPKVCNGAEGSVYGA